MIVGPPRSPPGEAFEREESSSHDERCGFAEWIFACDRLHRLEQRPAGQVYSASDQAAHRGNRQETWLSAERDGAVPAKQAESQRGCIVLRYHRPFLYVDHARRRERAVPGLVPGDFRRRAQPEEPLRTLLGIA